MPTDFRTSDGTNIVYVDGLTIGATDSAVAATWRVASKVSSAFAGGTTNAHGDFDGTGNPYTLFTVTGIVEVSVIGHCTTLLDGATATLEVGVTGLTAGLIAQTTATDIDLNEFWVDTAPAIAEAWPTPKIIRLSIIETVGTANITSGGMTYYCLWRPISSDGALVSA